jgi:predicted ATPase
VPPNRFYGRNAERVAIAEWREAGQAPLLTLTGPAGIGKTRLAAETLPDAAFVPLIDVEDGGLLWEAIRTALRLEEPPGQVTAARDLVIERLKARETLLLLDNFEQIADTGAPLVLDLVSAAPGTRCVITSRVRLELAGEEEIHLAPLSSDESQALFLDRARAVRRDFPDTPDVAPLCRLMDGLPLVLEIAASRALTLGPAQMREQLSDRFRFLVTRRRDLPARHQSLRAALEWSVNLLPPAVRAAFPLLSVFRGGFTLEAADALFDGALPAADAIETLRAHSLLTVDFKGGAAPRYDLLASVRAFGAERLPPEAAPAVRERYARHFAALVLEDDDPAGALPSTARLALWDRERENLRAILPSLEENDPATLARVALALFPYWESRSLLEEGARWSETAAHRCDDPACAAQLLTHLTRFRFYVSDLAAAAEAGREALAAAERAGSLVAEARANRYLGQIAVYQGDLAGATETLPKALDQFRTVGDAAGECDVLYVLGVLHAAMNRYDVAMGYLGECLALARRIGDTQTALMTVFFIGDGYVCLEEFDTAALHLAALRAEAEREGYVLPMAYYHWSEGVRLTEIGRAQEGLLQLREVARHTLSVHLRWGFALALEALGYNACALGQPERAVRLLAASARMQSEVNYRLTLNYVARHERYLTRLQAALPADRYAALWSEGDALPFDAVVHLALAEG